MKRDSLRNGFEMYAPYRINPELLFEIQFRSKSGEMYTSRQIIEMIVENNFTFDYSTSLESLNISIREKTISLISESCRDGSYVFEKFLSVLNASRDFNKAIYASWYYFDRCYIKEDPVEGYYYHFYVFYGEELILPDINVLSPPEGLFVKVDDEFFSNDRVLRLAMGRVLFKRWVDETLAGKIFFETNKIELDQGVIDSQYPLIAHLQAIHKEVKNIKLILMGTVFLLCYYILFK